MIEPMSNNVLGLCFIRIPSGPSTMGIDEEDERADKKYRETPSHTVYLDEYFIASHPVTVGLWTDYCRELGIDWSVSDWLASLDINAPHFSSGDQLTLMHLPITNVNWQEAMLFAAWMSSKTGRRISLPTEAQWERACRGEKNALFAYLAEDEVKELVIAGAGLRPVCHNKVRTNTPGCYDLWDNIAEWCYDWYDDNAYEKRERNVPTINPCGPTSGEYKSIRGGNALFGPCPRCTARNFDLPSTRSPLCGFRLVMQPKDG